MKILVLISKIVMLCAFVVIILKDLLGPGEPEISTFALLMLVLPLQVTVLELSAKIRKIEAS